MPLGGRGDDDGERPLAGLGRARDKAARDGHDQQEYEATAGETRRRHAERARSPHARRGPVKDPAPALRRAARDLLVFFALRLEQALPAGSRRSMSTTSLMGS